MDQSNRCARLDLDESDRIAGGKHVHCACIMKPKAGHGYLETAAHFAAAGSTGTNVEVSTTDESPRGVDALVCEIDPVREITKIACPVALFDRNIIAGRAMQCLFRTLTIGNNQGMGDVEYVRMHDLCMPPARLRLFDGPAMNIADMWRVLGRGVKDGATVVGTISTPKPGLRPQPFADARHEFRLCGAFIRNDEPHGNQVFAPLKATMPLVADAMKRAQDDTGEAKLFSAYITADDPYERIARGDCILEDFGENADHVAFPVDGHRTGPAAITTARRQFPQQFLQHHRAGHGAVTLPQSKRGYTAFVLSRMAHPQGASGIHTGTMGYGKKEGAASDRIMAYRLTEDSAPGPFHHRDWYGMKATTPILSDGMNGLRLPGCVDNLGPSNGIQASGGGALGHIDGGTAGAKSLRQARAAWKSGLDLVTDARERREPARAFVSFPNDADKLYPGLREALYAIAA